MSTIEITWFYKSTDLCLGLTKSRARQNNVSREPDRRWDDRALNAELVSMRRDSKTLQFEYSSFRYEGLSAGDLMSGSTSVPPEFKIAVGLKLENGIRDFLEQQENSEDVKKALQTKRLECGFTFRLIQKIKGLNLKQARSSQWLGAINNLPGVRAWEKEWCGLWHWLESMDREKRISKEEILSHINFHACELSLHLTWTTDGITPLQFETCDIPLPAKFKREIGLYGPLTKVRYVNRSLGYKVLETLRPDLFDNIHWWRVVDRNNNILESANEPVFTEPQKAIDFARRHASKIFSLRGNLTPSREWLNYSLAENEYSQYLVTLENFPADYESSHFNLRNVLFHLRTTVNFNRKANRVLLVEEIQSDWLQNPDNRHFTANSSSAYGIPVPLAKDWAKVGVMLSIWLAIQSNCEAVAWSNWQMQFGHYGNYANRHGLRNFYDRELPKIVNKVAKEFNCKVADSSVYIDGVESQCIRLEDQWVLEDTSGSVLAGPALSKNELLLKAIEKGLANSQKLQVMQISGDLRRSVAGGILI